MTEYVVPFSVDVRKAVPSIGDTLRPLDAALASCGVRMELRAKYLYLSCKSDRRLTQKERKMLKQAAQEALQERFPDYAIEAGTTRQKPCKPRSSASM